jgi:hypothetical protein
MKWLPRPSFRAAAVVGALLAVYLARGRRKVPVRGLGSRRLLRLA